MTNGYFRLEVRNDGTYLIVYPPEPGGSLCDPNEVLNYLDIYNVAYDKIAIYNLFRNLTSQKELRISVTKVSAFDETMDFEIGENCIFIFLL